MKKVSGKIYSKDLSPHTETVRINPGLPKHSRTTVSPNS